MEQQAPNAPLAEGCVIKTTGAHCEVKTPDGKIYLCIFRGKIRLDKNIRSTNPVAVGDGVTFQLPALGEMGVIHGIQPRKNYILRKAISHTHKVHILCANIDQAVLIFTLKQPHTTTGFANRFLVTAASYHVPAVVIINKIDILQTEEEKVELEKIKKCYELAGYPVHLLSALDPEYKQKVTELFSGKITFLGGHSGAGKSTLINLIEPDLQLRTNEISDYNDKGMHTTTHSQMYPVLDGYVIDAPGIKEMGMVDFDKYQLSHYFPEMLARLSDCKFNNCLHINEPHCAIKAAVESGEIALSRYRSYLKMMEEGE